MALEPINYMAQMGNSGQISLNDIVSGLQVGEALKQRRLQEQQQQLQEQARQDLNTFMSNPNPTEKDYADFMTKYPAYADSMKQRYEMLSAGEQKQTWKLAGQLDTAVKTGNLDVAESILQNEIDAYKNSGDVEGQKSMENLLKIFKSNPDAPLKMVNSMLYTADPERFAQNLKAIGEETRATELQPLEMNKAKLDIQNKLLDAGLKKAQTAKVWQEYQNAPIETNIKIQDMIIKKEEAKIKAMEAAAKKTENDMKREELQLKIEEKKLNLKNLQKETEQANNQIIADARSSVETIDNTLNTVDKILASPGLEMATGASSFFNVLPGTEGRDAAALIDTLKSQAFISEIQKMKGMGALSDAEGKKISDALGSLDVGQSTKQFVSTLDNIKSILNKTKTNIGTKFKNQLNQPTQETTTTIDDLLKKYGAK